MKSWSRTRIFDIILFILVVFIIGGIFIKHNEYTSISRCKVYEQNDQGAVLKLLTGTYDPSLYGTKVYLRVSSAAWGKMQMVAQEKGFDINGNIQVTFTYNKLFDVKKGEEGLYYKIDHVIDVEEFNYIPLS